MKKGEIVILDADDDIEPEDFIEPSNDTVTVRSWNIFLDNDLIDTVIYPSTFNSKQVKCRLVVQDDYPVEITVVEA